MKTDMVAMPKPLADTSIISTSSLFLLKYCPIIKVAGSLVIPTPTPVDQKKDTYHVTKYELSCTILQKLARGFV